MKRVTVYLDKRTGEVVVEHDPLLPLIEVFSALADASRTVYQTILDNEERKRKLESGQLEEIARLMIKQKYPKLN